MDLSALRLLALVTGALIVAFAIWRRRALRNGDVQQATFTFSSYLAAAALFVAITIPLARFTDWLIARDRRRRQATGAIA